ncbi:uncharacterized protein A1O5_07304 [Cladophialophora psammophila CBS 110553]|uniref:Major facilitator superfamily (MFS) profile domain-containing protein n=1 Tax=Cladophialophora psammophila CBS 110553 TaxID=1182543 RepID=W9WMZ3_9EURO|nr:uncharacterized protein A1O5_07304 [Cladophialophora psammophila CBS 110553]EXJ69268.1 hypothetical protein A1O5_07304 [Cladophialophora psammophila CBS 110553]
MATRQEKNDIDLAKDEVVESEFGGQAAYYVPKTKMRNVWYVLMVGTGQIAGGGANAVIATTLAQPTFVSKMSLDGPNSNSLMGGTNGSFYAGGFFGVFFAAWACDTFGRRKAMWLTGVLNIISCILCASSVNIGMFIAVRFIAGFAACQYVMQTPLYQSEIAPPHLRGLLVGTFGIFNVLGYNIANWSGVGFYHVKDSNIAWRMIFVMVGGLAIINMILVYFCPESPRWLVMKNRQAEAEQVIRLIHGDSGDDTFVKLETIQIERQVATERELNVSYIQMFADKRWRRRTLLCCLIGTVGQSTGVLVINNYGPYFYSILGMSTLQQLYLAGGYVLLSLTVATIGAFGIDKLGRIKIMVCGIAGQVVILCIETAIVAQYAGTANRSANIAGIWAFFMYCAVYGLTWDCTPYVYVSEIMPSHLRAKGVTLSIGCLYLSVCALITGALYAFGDIGWKYFLVFICAGPVGALLIWLYGPETKGKTLEEIGGIFGDELAIPELHATDESHITQKRAA